MHVITDRDDAGYIRHIYSGHNIDVPVLTVLFVYEFHVILRRFV
jgi:hypothetical protein